MLHPVFWEIHSGLPREGPGDNVSTRRAYAMADELPLNPRILDIGCGPGQQTLELAAVSGSRVVAVDLQRPFLQDLRSRALERGLGKQIAMVNASMAAPPFADQSFDLIWCEGAMYNLGFAETLATWKRVLRPRGYVAVTEPCWLKPDAPEDVRTMFAEYAAMAFADDWLSVIANAGYETVGRFTLPASSWWDDYYAPMIERLAVLRERYRDDDAALEVIAEHDREIDAYRKHSAYYGYVFFVLRLI